MSSTATKNQPHDYGPAALKEFYFRYDGNNYVLVEARGDVAIDYRDQLQKQIRYSERGGHSEGAAKFEPGVIARCLFKIGEDGAARSPMTAGFVRGLGNHIMADLWARLDEMSGLSPRVKDATADRISALEEKLERLLEDRHFAAESNGEVAEGNALQ